LRAREEQAGCPGGAGGPATDFYTQIDRLAKCGLLYLIAEKFTGIDLHPDQVSNTEMGTVFEELIRKFAEISNGTAGNA
jgi:type I restriction enzyme M protein